MGNVIGIQFSGDTIFSLCLNCTLNKAAYVSKLEDNLRSLQTELEKVIEARNDVTRRVMVAEQRRMKRTDQVQGWLSRVQAAETEVGKLTSDSSQEIEKLCLGGYCSKNFKSSYKFGKQVAKMLLDVETLMGGSAFEVVAETVPAESVVADERPTEPIVVGLQSILEQVWRCLVQETAGIIGIYGMGGVGKTTLLTHINNKFLERPSGFDFVIWVVVSKDLQLEKIQDMIGKKIGLFDDLWKYTSLEEKAQDIFKVLSKKKFVLLLDDLWERVDLTKLGVPLPSLRNIASKVVLTTRLLDVCGLMEVHRKFKMECLSDKDAWYLFQEKVGEETLNYHGEILELAEIVAKECDGLPLALITIGRAMAYKKTPAEWRYAIQVLRRAASEFPGLGKEVFSLLKFSYDSLLNDTIRSCLLYCSLYPEDCHILKKDLIDCWIGEGFLDKSDRFEVQNQGYYTIGILLHACLLEEVEDDEVKMHDVIRDMTLWIASEVEKEKENFLVYAGAGLTKASVLEGWINARRLSLMENQIEDLTKIYLRCPHLLTLFLNKNELEVIPSHFFHFIPSLQVLNLSHLKITVFPSGISKLVSLHHLDLSHTRIKELPTELRFLVNLKCLNLNHTMYLCTIPQQLISKFSMLHVLRMFSSLYFKNGGASGDGLLFARDELLVEELLGLKYLEVLDFTLTSSHVLQIFFTSHELQSCAQALFLDGFKDSKSIDASQLANLKHLNRLRIRECEELEELKIGYATSQPCVFHSLHKVQIGLCSKLKDLTFLVFAPNVKSIDIRSCTAMEEVISVQKISDFPEIFINNIKPFAKLQHLELVCLRNLKSIYWKSLPFPRLKEMLIDDCYMLRKLPLNSKGAKERKLVIRGEEYWWRGLQWEDEATQNAFLPCFKSLGH